MMQQGKRGGRAGKNPSASKCLGALAAVATAFATLATSVAFAQASPSPMTITFAAQAGQQALRCGEAVQGLGRSAATAQVRDVRFYVSEVALLDAQGQPVPLQLLPGAWQDASVALLDLVDKGGACAAASAASPSTVNTTITATAPPASRGPYTGLRFTLGVPHALNHSDYVTADSPLDVQFMAWSWQGGRKFLHLDLEPAGGVARLGGPEAPGRTFQLHLGSTGCQGNPMSGQMVACQRPNRVPVVLEGFDPARDQVVFDVQALLAHSRIDQDAGGSLGCMGAVTDPECGPLYTALGLDIASGQPTANASQGQEAAAVWRVQQRP